MPGKRSKNEYRVFIGLGSNLGNRTANLEKALKAIEDLLFERMTVSSFYETEAWGEKDQQNYINAVCQGLTHLQPAILFSRLQKIESDLGKRKESRWGPRIIDLDILYFDQKIIVEKDLIIPHPNMYLRNFVLTPLAEIAPEFVHPILMQTTKSLLERCPDTGKIEKLSAQYSKH